MKMFLAMAAVLVAAPSSAASQQADASASEPSAAADQDNVIIVEARRLAEELKNTTLVMVRGRNDRVTIKIRGDGTFASSLNGLRSDFGRWRVVSNNVCFEGRSRGSFCTPTLFFGRPGDTWTAVGLDGKEYEARLIADS